MELLITLSAIIGFIIGTVVFLNMTDFWLPGPKKLSELEKLTFCPDIEIVKKGNKRAVMLIHEYQGTPESVRYQAESLARAGCLPLFNSARRPPTPRTCRPGSAPTRPATAGTSRNGRAPSMVGISASTPPSCAARRWPRLDLVSSLKDMTPLGATRAAFFLSIHLSSSRAA